MISNGEKGSIAKTERQQWHYLAVKKLSALLRGMNEKHLTFSFEWETSDYTIYSRMVSNMSDILDVTVSLMGGKMSTDLYLKATDSHQYLHCFSCHLYHCKKGISHCQAVSLNRICSDPISLDKRCNHLEKWLIERGYSEREVGKQILRARGFQETPCWIEKIPEKNKTK